MAKVANVNIPNQFGGTSAIFNLKTTLLSAGWVVSASSDGTTLSGSSDIITHSGSGAGGLNNDLAWFWIKDPAGLRSFTVQRSNGSLPQDNWRIKWIRTGSMNLNTGSVTITPSSSFEQNIHGSGSDVAPQFSKLFPTSVSGTATWKTHAVAMSTIDNSRGVYGFYCFSTLNGNGNGVSLFACDPLIQGGSSPSNPEPYALYNAFHETEILEIGTFGQFSSTAGGTGEGSSVITTTTKIKFWNGTVFVPFSIDLSFTGVSSTGTAWSTLGTSANPFDASECIMPVFYLRVSTTVYAQQVGGFSKYICMSTVDRNYPYVINLTTDAKVYFGSLLLPWPESVSPLG